MDLQSVIDQLRAWPPWIVYALLFAGAFIEYILPFLPGDMFVVAGAVLVAAFDWHPIPVLGIVTAGAILGAWVDFRIGLWLVRTNRLHRLGPGASAAVESIVARMHKHGPVYLAVNRFIPALRAFFFVAAGVARLRTGTVLLWSGVSALAWNILLVGVGYALGANIAAIESFFTQYAIIAWSLIGAVVLVLIVRWLVKRRRARAAKPPEK
ncbi:MAG: VTT domain-containing protein [Deltaproteobacteria bacterium]|nr:VTT domain-containing protein [Deltaproteobacteria bacterium]